MIVVCGPTAQSSPIVVSPFRLVPGSIDRVLADRDADVDVRRAGSRIVTPLRGVALVDALLGELADLGELDAVVDAERERVVGDQVRADRLARLAELRQHVGQVELALRVVGVELRSSASSSAAPSNA